MKKHFLLNTFSIVSVCLAMFSCGRIDGGEGGSETSFVKCATKADCQTGYDCVEKVCRKPALLSEADAATEKDSGPGQPLLKPDSGEPSDVLDGGTNLPAVRPACEDSADCPSGSLCHLDDKCLPWGEKDEQGAELLATAPGNPDFYHAITSLWVSDDGVYWLEWGTTDALKNKNRDGAVRFLAHGDSEPSLIHGGFVRPAQMIADDGQLLVLDQDGRIVELTLEPQTAVRSFDVPCGRDCQASFAPVPGGLYYATWDQDTEKGTLRFQSRVSDTEPVVVEQSDRYLKVLPGGESIYLQFASPPASTRAVNKQTREILDISYMRDLSPAGLTEFAGDFYYSWDLSGNVFKLSSTGEPTNLYPSENPYPTVIFSVSEQGIVAQADYRLIVVPTTRGVAQVSFTLEDENPNGPQTFVSAAQIHGKHVYFAVEGRLMRRSL